MKHYKSFHSAKNDNFCFEAKFFFARKLQPRPHIAFCAMKNLISAKQASVVRTMNRLYFLAGICALSALTSKAENFSVIMPEFPRPVTIAFPSGFRPASSNEERIRNAALMAYWRLNPSIKGNYEHAFLKDWQNPEPMPQIVIGTLGVTKGKQGKISAKNWAEIRGYLLEASQKEIDKVRKEITPKIMRTSSISEEIQNDLVWIEKQDDPSTATILCHINANREGQIIEHLSARKVMYHNGFMMFANVVVEANKPDALNEIRNYLNSLHLLSVE
jgi:hypothetical protein